MIHLFFGQKYKILLFLPASERFISTPVSTSYSCFFLFIFFFLGSKAILGTWNILVLCDSTSYNILILCFLEFLIWFVKHSWQEWPIDLLYDLCLLLCSLFVFRKRQQNQAPAPKIMCSTSKLSDNLVFLSVSLRFKCIACLNVMSVSSRSLILPVLKK